LEREIAALLELLCRTPLNPYGRYEQLWTIFRGFAYFYANDAPLLTDEDDWWISCDSSDGSWDTFDKEMRCNRLVGENEGGNNGDTTNGGGGNKNDGGSNNLAPNNNGGGGGGSSGANSSYLGSQGALLFASLTGAFFVSSWMT